MDDPRLVNVSIRVPSELRNRMMALAANNPAEFFTTTHAWIKAAREFLEKHEVD